MSTIDRNEPPTGRLEQAIEEFRERLENIIEHIATVAGSYLRTYTRYVVLFVMSLWRIAILAWLFFILPYSAWGAVGEYLIRHVPPHFGLGFVGFLLVALPPVVVGLVLYSYHKPLAAIDAPAGPPTAKKPTAPPEPGRNKSWRDLFRVVPSMAGYRFWLGVIGSGIVVSLTIFVGWLVGIGPLVHMHDTILAWPNMAPLDFLANLASTVVALIIEFVT